MCDREFGPEANYGDEPQLDTELRIQVRLPTELHRRIRRAAKLEYRSSNSLMVWMWMVEIAGIEEALMKNLRLTELPPLSDFDNEDDG